MDVSILTPPEDGVLPGLIAPPQLRSMFQSSPRPKTGCYAVGDTPTISP